MDRTLKWYDVKVPVYEGSALDQRIQSLCKDNPDREQTIVQLSVVTGLNNHMHNNLELLERNGTI